MHLVLHYIHYCHFKNKLPPIPWDEPRVCHTKEKPTHNGFRCKMLMQLKYKFMFLFICKINSKVEVVSCFEFGGIMTYIMSYKWHDIFRVLFFQWLSSRCDHHLLTICPWKSAMMATSKKSVINLLDVLHWVCSWNLVCWLIRFVWRFGWWFVWWVCDGIFGNKECQPRYKPISSLKKLWGRMQN
jgi:hypothetical protein